MNKDNSRSIPVSAATAERIRGQIAATDFASEDEVIQAALEALERQTRDRADDLAWIKARIKASVEDTRPGYSSEEMSQHLRQLFERAEQQRHDSAA
jgi:antitoxin ParD1/3/4